MPQYTRDWFSKHEQNWLKWFSNLSGRAGVKGIEIGSFEGRSAVWLLSNVLTGPGATLVCIDVWEPETTTPYPDKRVESRFDSNVAPYAHRVRKLKGRSVAALAGLVSGGESGSFDFAYIDGGHAGADVLTDAALCFELIRQGGTLLFDDYRWSRSDVAIPPGRAIDAFRQAFADRIESIYEGDQVLIEARKPGGSNPLGLEELHHVPAAPRG